MKPIRLLMLPMLVLGLSGCVLMGPSYTEPVDFDLGVPAAEAVKPAALPIRFGVFCNLSGSNRGFLVRESGDRLSSDEYNRWLLSPELLLQRRIRTELPDPAGEKEKSVRLNATIYRFEFDRTRHMAVLSVEFSGKAGDVTERTSQLTYETPYEGDAPEAAAKAMAMNAGKATEAVRELITSLSKKLK